MNRIYTLIGLVLAVLVAVFSLASFMAGYLTLMLAIAVVLVAVGVMTGQ